MALQATQHGHKHVMERQEMRENDAGYTLDVPRYSRTIREVVAAGKSLYYMKPLVLYIDIVAKLCM